ncbi:2-beta-glucuronyltransferase [Palleronia aestuarii]|uniref:2-beta-glucuronyltransferase n=1 Tax=Palleronia aestuarii TaxID=568105 RepID=A0A2W7MSA9_9RHOB|nr:glycosyltransferase family 4 protein [Palleronia aestuarii]PZX10361.1 2-beta-glucuronyltransferase [Palleronia aestuarii]
MTHVSPGTVLFLSNHYWRSKRRAGFHGLAQSFRDDGWLVRFVTTGVSRLSFLKADPRLVQMRHTVLNRWMTGCDGIESFVYCPPVHPFSRSCATDGITDRLFARLYRCFVPSALRRRIAESDLVVFESSAALLLFDAVCHIAPNARRVYRVSDDVRVVGMAPEIQSAEDAAAPHFHLVSVPSRMLLERRFGDLPAAQFHPHGIDIPRLRAALEAPAKDLAHPNCVALGTTLFNTDLLALCARSRPDIRFYIVGAVPKNRRIDLKNITWCGERPFQEALEMVAACDIAAAFYRPEPGTEYLAETSNKIAQYIFFRKPVVGPAHLAPALPASNFFAVAPSTLEGASSAIGQALNADPSEFAAASLRAWTVVRDEIVAQSGLAGLDEGVGHLDAV